jgi:hypothetical protein
MSNQSEALRLAETLVSALEAELRRLHAVNQELLEALKLAMLDWENMRVVPSASRAHKAARAAIKKAEGQHDRQDHQ